MPIFKGCRIQVNPDSFVTSSHVSQLRNIELIYERWVLRNVSHVLVFIHGTSLPPDSNLDFVIKTRRSDGELQLPIKLRHRPLRSACLLLEVLSVYTDKILVIVVTTAWMLREVFALE